MAEEDLLWKACKLNLHWKALWSRESTTLASLRSYISWHYLQSKFLAYMIFMLHETQPDCMVDFTNFARWCDEFTLNCR